MRWKTFEEGIEKLREVAVLEVLFGRGGQHDNDPDKVSPEAPCILGIDFPRNSNYKDLKGLRWAFGIAAVEAEGIKKLNTLPGLSEDSSAIGLLQVEEQRVPVATLAVHRWKYRTNREAVTPIHRMIHELEAQGVVSKTHCAGLKAKPNAGLSLLSAGGVCGTPGTDSPRGGKHSPSNCHGLIQAALEKGEALEYVQYIDDIIVWGNTAMEVFEKGEKIIQILLEAGFAIKKSSQGTCPRDPVPRSKEARWMVSDSH
ncbi:hypothetical protein DUI87_17774 [Hirundo rustica rustica]|uniref:Reverse transcriptase domain-containing protein n=1 Tax=Hirundo rustica rustica TaxID=333673 RepID=A0A3M0JXP6_HIRRU|nr:hypothetical protein DUI87_17774 [Hirundo rustica rustica]